MDPNTKTEIRVETWGDKHFMVRAGNYSLTAKVISKAQARRLARKMRVRTDWPPKLEELWTGTK